MQNNPVSNPSYGNPAKTLRERYVVVDNFLPDAVAQEMRKGIEDHFANPNQHKPETHQVWNYWFIAELYIYFRTRPQKIIKQEHVDTFVGQLREWSRQTLGMPRVSWPYLSMYVSGCKQGLHNDSLNGRFAFVYSLTKNVRKTSGGNTIVMHEGDLFRSRLDRSGAGTCFYDAVAPVFNRLIVFDDRIPHAVDQLEGSMEPTEGRFVLHGHIYDEGILTRGELTAAIVTPLINPVVEAFRSACASNPAGFHGPLAALITVQPSGEVSGYRLLMDRVTCPHPHGQQERWNALAHQFLQSLTRIRFPAGRQATDITIPVMLGPPILA